jgi:dTDP-glucose pyrophosphorylase
MSQPELTIYVELILEESPKFMFVLSQTTKNITSNMDKGHLKDFLSINKRGRKSKKENPIQDFFVKNIEEQFIEDYVEQDELIKRQEQILQDYINYYETNLSIDEILEKIHEKGLNSLTKAERKKLDEYSKEK